jgi:hypothetical protein
LCGCPLSNIREDIVISRKAFVVIRVRLGVESVSKGILHKVPHYVGFTIDGVNNACLVYSDCDVYPNNLDSSVPVFDDLCDAEVRNKISNHSDFFEYINKTPSLTERHERRTSFRLI